MCPYHNFHLNNLFSAYWSTLGWFSCLYLFHMFMLFIFSVVRSLNLVLNPSTSSERLSISDRYKPTKYTYTIHAIYHVNIVTVNIINDTGRKWCCPVCHWWILLRFFFESDILDIVCMCVSLLRFYFGRMFLLIVLV